MSGERTTEKKVSGWRCAFNFLNGDDYILNYADESEARETAYDTFERGFVIRLHEGWGYELIPIHQVKSIDVYVADPLVQRPPHTRR